jgi:phosphoribosylanthranilate isomerase
MRKSIIIKICGITNADDAAAAAESGADFIGLIFVPESPRFVTEAAAKNIIQRLNGRCKTVAVYKNADVELIAGKKKEIGFDITQLHGDETPAAAKALRPTIKALTVSSAHEAVSAQAFAGAVDYVLFDRHKGNGGADWLTSIMRELPALSMNVPFLLAGGLNPGNVAAAVQSVGAHAQFTGVDVASGIESIPGLKDHAKMQAFIKQAREAAHASSR